MDGKMEKKKSARAVINISSGWIRERTCATVSWKSVQYKFMSGTKYKTKPSDFVGEQAIWMCRFHTK